MTRETPSGSGVMYWELGKERRLNEMGSGCIHSARCAIVA
jgi:hypothetical protein